MIAEQIHTSDFRDTLSTSSKIGDRITIYPKIIVGDLYKWRMVVAFILIGLLFAGPFLEFNGHPLFLFNIILRKFILFGVSFWPQDFYLLALICLTFMVFVLLFTVVYGRIWCGWACPQTIFMEMVFRRIETWIEGDSYQQYQFNHSAPTIKKVLKKTLKHSLFFFISFLISNVFLAYFIGKHELFKLVTEGLFSHWLTLIFLLIFTVVFYFVFAKFRELVCIIVCPYGRLQGVMLDKKSVVVAYDYKRGEPRGHIKREAENKHLGDCIDCKLCVQVCPTGIDIRNGTQLECVNCTACIDACNGVMEKIGKPKNLITYASQEGLESGNKIKFNGRIAAYTLVLFSLAGVLIVLLMSRKEIQTTVLRTPGMLYQTQQNGNISNLYNYEIINKTFNDIEIELKTEYPGAKIQLIGNKKLNIPEEGNLNGVLFIEIPKSNLPVPDNKVVVQIWKRGQLIDNIVTAFVY